MVRLLVWKWTPYYWSFPSGLLLVIIWSYLINLILITKYRFHQTLVLKMGLMPMPNINTNESNFCLCRTYGTVKYAIRSPAVDLASLPLLAYQYLLVILSYYYPLCMLKIRFSFVDCWIYKLQLVLKHFGAFSSSSDQNSYWQKYSLMQIVTTSNRCSYVDLSSSLIDIDGF